MDSRIYIQFQAGKHYYHIGCGFYITNYPIVMDLIGKAQAYEQMAKILTVDMQVSSQWCLISN